MKFALCLRKVFVIGVYTYIFRGEFLRGSLPWEGKFPEGEMNFQGEFCTGGIF